MKNQPLPASIAPLSPGEIIEKRLLVNGRSQADLADEIGISRQALNMVLKGRRPLSASIAIKLSNVSGDTPQQWIDRQDEYDAWSATPAAQNLQREAKAQDCLAEWNRRGTRLLVDSEIKEGLELGLITISEFNAEHLDPASYDLTVGKILPHRGGTPLSARDGFYTLPPGTYFIGCARETVRLSNQILCRLGQTTDLIEAGVVVALGLQVDPGYKKGDIIFGIENRTTQDVMIDENEVCLSLEFHFLARQPVAPAPEHPGADHAHGTTARSAAQTKPATPPATPPPLAERVRGPASS